MSELFNAYDAYLIGRKNGIGNYHFFGDSPGGSNEKMALSCIRYAIEYLLRWNGEMAIKKFDRITIERLKLGKMVSYIDYPIYVLPGDPKYILSKLYPERVQIHPEKCVEEIYQKVLEEGIQFPREFFTGEDGFKRFSICLSYLIRNYKVFHSLEEIYRFFSSSDGSQFLSVYRLKSPAFQLGINPIDVIYELTKEEDDSRLYYCYYCFLPNVS